MRRWIWILIFFSIGLINLGYGVSIYQSEDEFFSNCKKIRANIYGVDDREDEKKVLYINYIIDAKEYDSFLVVSDSHKVSDYINICYDIKNPLVFRENKDYSKSKIPIIIGVISLVLGIIYIFIKK